MGFRPIKITEREQEKMKFDYKEYNLKDITLEEAKLRGLEKYWLEFKKKSVQNQVERIVRGR